LIFFELKLILLRLDAQNTTMKPTSFLYLFLFLCVTVSAQVGIGTTTPNASLDIRSGNQAAPANTDGILIPKIDVFPATNPTALQHSMLVFLTTVIGTNQPGFYYWNNPTTSWIGVGSTLTNDWGLLGNIGTDPSINYVGTTDNKDLVFKRNAVKAGFIGDPTYDASFFYTNGNTSFGANSLLSPSITTGAPQLGVRNTALGSNVMPGLTIGRRNVGVGDIALFSNTSGSENTAVGVGALYSNAIGAANVAIGRNALTTATGGNNTAIGFAALRQNAGGTNNTAVGNQAGYMNGGSSNVFLGNDAGYNESGSNKLYISNSNADATTALVYGEFTSSPKVFRTNSQFQIGDPATTGYKFPTARGTNKQVLETDGVGALTWVNGINSMSVARATLSASQALGTGGWQKVNFNTVIYDANGEFNTGAGRFVAAKAGYYRINAGMHTNNQGNTQFYSIGIYVNGILYQEHTGNHNGSGAVSRYADCVVNLAVGGYVEVYVQNYQGGVDVDSFPSKTYFEVQQIR
jgi:hypothetical protein